MPMAFMAIALSPRNLRLFTLLQAVVLPPKGPVQALHSQAQVLEYYSESGSSPEGLYRLEGVPREESN
jgi:hypothetical protein